MNPMPFQTLTSRAARVRAALASMTDGAVFELPTATLRGRFTDVQKIIAWRKLDGGLELRTWDESEYKGSMRWKLDSDGRLFDNDVPTIWWAYDLRPTGENAIRYICDALPDDNDDDTDIEPTHGRIIPLRREG